MTDESSEKDRATSKLSEEFISLRTQQTRRRTFSGVKSLDKTIKISLYCCVVLITAAASGRRCEIEMLISSAHSSHIHFYCSTWNGNFKKTSQKCLWRACWVNWPFPHFSIPLTTKPGPTRCEFCPPDDTEVKHSTQHRKNRGRECAYHKNPSICVEATRNL